MHRRTLLLGALALGGCGMAGNLRQGLDMAVVNERLLLSGVITSRSPAAFAEILQANPQITTVVLQDMQGSLDDEAVTTMGHAIRDRGLTTALQSDSSIHSGAVDLYLAGRRRTMVRGAEIGVHSWADSFGDGRDYPPDAAEHVANRRYVVDMLGSEDFYWFSLRAAPSDAIYVMDEAEIIRFGLVTGEIRDFN